MTRKLHENLFYRFFDFLIVFVENFAVGWEGIDGIYIEFSFEFKKKKLLFKIDR
jgi:hypothetical protein